MVLPPFGIALLGSPGGQDACIRTLLERAEADNYLFVINGVSRDFDAGAASLPTEAQELASIWQNTGLFDQAGAARPALATGRDVFKRPLR